MLIVTVGVIGKVAVWVFIVILWVCIFVTGAKWRERWGIGNSLAPRTKIQTLFSDDKDREE